MTAKIRLFVIADNELSAEAIARALAAGDGLDLVGRASSGAAEAAGIARRGAEVVLVDARHRAAAALGLVRDLSAALAAAGAGARLLPVGLGDADEVVLFLEAGASGYVLQDESLADVREAIAAVAAGEPRCAPEVAALVFSRIGELARRRAATLGAAAPTPESLSDREVEVLDLLARGLRNKEIARRLGVALSTAGHHVQNVLAKLGTHRRRDAVRRAVERGLLDVVPSFEAA